MRSTGIHHYLYIRNRNKLMTYVYIKQSGLRLHTSEANLKNIFEWIFQN